jgi:hypothetical protein
MAYATIVSVGENGIGVVETFNGEHRYEFVAVGSKFAVGQVVEFATKTVAVNVRPASQQGSDKVRGWY